ncbi:HNH endonuclease [Flavobacterium supellecticarium]|uniref:HNH endonuclease n=1 Tax=Flavobacterium supellecticarium TaxID=2565924 RepID=A0A4S4A0B1_9FLAO|nr:HNH endonuclease signature motif containing protein [Flavobacterium supellecticarium]THF51734.1 HNH endonuclease [Flavobacterium supellecticarium]
MEETYIQYGVSSDLAQKLKLLGIPKTTFEKTSNKNLREKYFLPDDEIILVKELIKRQPIREDIIEKLLENSNYTCCICKGTKGKSYIIHHIEEYSTSQNNEYHNLAVLCPDDHDIAHKKGKSLTLKLTENQINNAKYKWEEEVKRRNIEKASKNGNIFEVDFINIPRILELCIELFDKIPNTRYTEQLLSLGLITIDGGINETKLSEVNENPTTPLIFFAPHGAAILKAHYYEIFQKVLMHLNFIDLDLLLNRNSIKSGIVGEYCYYVGGPYSSKLPNPITKDCELMRFYFKRKPFIVEWLVDPKYFSSSSAKHRTNHRNVYMIYGKIRNVNIEIRDDKQHIIIDIRPYCFGLPELRKHRVPDIAYRDKYDDIFDENDIDSI